MRTFETLDRQLDRVPAEVVRLLSEIDRFQGREDAFKRQHPEMLETLIQIARVQSTEASNAIEDIHAPRERIVKLVAEKTNPENRSEEEIAGYRYVLDLIHANVPNIPITWNVVQQLHKDLYRFTPERNVGRVKFTDNLVTDKLPHGGQIVRFKPVDAGDAERYMVESHGGFDRVAQDGRHHPLLLAAAYLFDFTVIHPFQDGNGRMSRLLTLLLLYDAGYGVGRYVSLERLVAETKATYYDALKASTESWEDGDHDIYPWTRYILGVIVAGYKEFEDRIGAIQGVRGAKKAAVIQFVRSSVSDEFAFDDIRTACPSVSDSTIKKTLGELKEKDVVRALSSGRSAGACPDRRGTSTAVLT